MALPTTTSPNTDITAGIDAMRQMPTFGRTSEQEQNTINAAETASEALAQRYANPNWFNVAAGFLKPQLGGFMASLGSASQAMGENLEKQRANEIPTYVARAQVGLMKAQRENKLKAQDLFDKFVAEGSPVGKIPVLKAELSRLNATDLATDLQGVLDNSKTLNESTNNTNSAIMDTINTSLSIVKDENTTLAQKNAAMEALAKVNPGFLKLMLANGVAAPTAGTAGAAAGAAAGTAAGTAGTAAVPAVPAANEGPAARIPVDAGEGGVNSATKLSLNKDNLKTAQDYVSDLGTLAQANVQPFNALSNIYTYFKDPGVRKAMGQFDKGDVQSLMKQALQGQNVSGAIRNIVDRAVPTEIEAQYPGTADKVQTLLGVAAQQQLSINNTTANPTRTTQALEKSAVFNPTDQPDTAARKVLLALHALQQAQYAQPIANNLFKQGLGHTDITNSPLMRKSNERWGGIHERLSKEALPDVLPPGLQNYYGTQNRASGIEATLRANAAKTQ